MPVNQHGQPIGFALADWKPPARPSREPMAGRFCRVEPLDVDRHAADLHRAYSEDVDGRLWTYMHYGPFQDAHAFVDCVRPFCTTPDKLAAAQELRRHGAAAREPSGDQRMRMKLFTDSNRPGVRALV